MPTMFTEKSAALSGDASCTLHADAIAASQEFRNSYESKLSVVKGKDMPWERSPDGLIKHLVKHQMNTRGGMRRRRTRGRVGHKRVSRASSTRYGGPSWAACPRAAGPLHRAWERPFVGTPRKRAALPTLHKRGTGHASFGALSMRIWI